MTPTGTSASASRPARRQGTEQTLHATSSGRWVQREAEAASTAAGHEANIVRYVILRRGAGGGGFHRRRTPRVRAVEWWTWTSGWLSGVLAAWAVGLSMLSHLGAGCLALTTYCESSFLEVNGIL